MTAIAARITKFRENNQLLSIFLASCLIGLFAQIRIPLPFSPVPLTGQTFGVMLVGVLLGKKKGALAALFYLVQGSLGCPVWAGGKAGFHHFFGPTGGYLLAYPLEAYLIGWCLEHKARTVQLIGALFIPWSLQLAIGTVWLAFFVGADQAISLGFCPFIAIEIAKASLIIFYKKVQS